MGGRSRAGLIVVGGAWAFFRPGSPQGTIVVQGSPGNEKKDDTQVEPRKEQVEPKRTEAKNAGDTKWVETTKVVPPRGVFWTNSIGMKFVWISPGAFDMGSPESELGRGPNETSHAVEFTQGFYLAAHEVTQEQYAKVMGKNPSQFSAEGPGKDRLRGAPPEKLPVESVSYLDAVQYCKALGQLDAEKMKQRTYRLPTEAEWECACRAGTKTPFWSGKTLSPAEGRCDFGPAGGVPQPKRPDLADSLVPNPWGLYHMHGNVAEWCGDWYVENPQGGRDPQGPKRGTNRVLRGGGFYATPEKCRSADRFHAPPDTVDFSIGFRMVSPVAP